MGAGHSLGLVLTLIFTLDQKTNSSSSFIESRDLTLEKYVPTTPKQPEQATQRAEPRRAQRQYTNRIELVKDNVKADMPDQHQLQIAQISTQTIEGLATDGPGDEPPAATGNGNAEANNKPAEPASILSSSEARFPGGVESFKKFLTKNLVTPDDLQVDEKKTVLARFKVDIDGSISSVQILQSGGDKYDKEVIRVLNKMPKWVPATQNGAKVATWFTQPVSFIGVE
jgi:protein TonB